MLLVVKIFPLGNDRNVCFKIEICLKIFHVTLFKILYHLVYHDGGNSRRLIFGQYADKGKVNRFRVFHCTEEFANSDRRQPSAAFLHGSSDSGDTEGEGDDLLVFITDNDKIFFVYDKHKLVDKLCLHFFGERNGTVQMTVTAVKAVKYAVLVFFYVFLF